MSRFRSLTAVFLPACLAVGCARPPAPETPPPAPVVWKAPRSVDLNDWAELFGTTQPLPDHLIHVTAPIDGRVMALLKPADPKRKLAEGGEVLPGDVIVQLDDRIPRSNRDKAKATEASLADEENQAKGALDLATEKYNNLDAAHKKNADLVSEIDLKTAKSALEDAKSKLSGAKQRRAATAADTAALEDQLKLYAISTPRPGFLGRLQVSPGQTLKAGDAIADIVDLKDQIDVLCFVPPGVAARLQPSQEAYVGGVDEATASDPKGEVVFVADQADADTGLCAVKVRFSNTEAHLRSNTVARLRVVTRTVQGQLSAEDSALLEDQDPPSVVIVENVKTQKNADGKEEEVGTARRLRAVVILRDRVAHQVQLKLEDPDKKWTGTVDDDTRFVTQNGQGLQTGDPVKLQEEED
jgi:multidrug efflux pump subunit AcrA (membrane-fusion protein)